METSVSDATQNTAPVKPTFEQAYPEIARIVARRESSWTYLSIMPWEDVSQELFIRINEKWGLYDPEKAPKLEHWVNTVITRALLNLRRDTHLRYARPCIGGGKTNGKSCSFNTGGDSCSYTPSGRQCEECPVFKEWKERREAQHHVQSTVSLENHAQEVHSMPSDTMDTDAIEAWLHEQMLKELTRWEGRVYRLLIMRHVPPAEASEQLASEVAKRKRPPAQHEQFSYHACLQYARQFRGMQRVLLHRQGYIGDQHLLPPRKRR